MIKNCFVFVLLSLNIFPIFVYYLLFRSNVLYSEVIYSFVCINLCRVYFEYSPKLPQLKVKQTTYSEE